MEKADCNVDESESTELKLNLLSTADPFPSSFLHIYSSI